MASTKSTARRENGAGSITRSKSGYRASIRVPTADGGSRQRFKRCRTMPEAEAWLAQMRSQYVGGAVHTHAGTWDQACVVDYLRHWLTERFKEAEATGTPTLSTVRLYDTQIKTWIVGSPLGGLRLLQVHPDNVRAYVGWLAVQKSAKTGKVLSRPYQRTILVLLRMAFAEAVRQGIIPRSPAEHVKIATRAGTPVRERAMSRKDFEAFMALVRGKRCQHPRYCVLRWELAAVYAKRQSEVLGLTWGAVMLDEARPIIKIETHLVPQPWRHGCGMATRQGDGTFRWPCGGRTGAQCPRRQDGGLLIEAGTKTGRDRVPPIPVSESLRALILEHRRQQDAERDAARKAGRYAPERPEHEALVFTSPMHMTAIPPANDAKLFKSLLVEAGVQPTYRVHDLRHTAVTRIISATGNLAVGRTLAGHRSIATTAQYAHPDLQDVAAGIEAVMGLGADA